jgi:hypothetical protein
MAGLPGAARGALSLLGAGVQTIKPQTPQEKLQSYVERARGEVENKGLSDPQLRLNARVNLEVGRFAWWRAARKAGRGAAVAQYAFL